MSDVDDLEKLRRYWDERAKATGDDRAKVDAHSRTQAMRFSAFTHYHALEGKSVLDIGCGVGDLLQHLRDRNVACHYHGVDLSSEMIDRCRKRFHDAEFSCSNVLEWDDSRRYDYTVAFGIHNNVRFDGYHEFLERMTRKQFALCAGAAHLSLLTDRFPGFAEHMQAFRAERILTLALEITPYVSLRHDYLPHDFGITLYREPLIDSTRDIRLD